MAYNPGLPQLRELQKPINSARLNSGTGFCEQLGIVANGNLSSCTAGPVSGALRAMWLECGCEEEDGVAVERLGPVTIIC